jgi:four helix bundle protein
LVWNKSVDFVVQICQMLSGFPKNEQFGLISQMQRAAVSIPSNIAEGKERQSDKDFARFITIALGSLAELKTPMLISYKLGDLQEKDWQEATVKAEEIGKMLRGLHKTLSIAN